MIVPSFWIGFLFYFGFGEAAVGLWVARYVLFPEKKEFSNFVTDEAVSINTVISSLQAAERPRLKNNKQIKRV